MEQNNLSRIHQPYIEIIEQPAFDSFTFRYESEIKGKALGCIHGVHSTAEAKTFPTIKIMNYQGPYAVVVSCVTKEGPPHRPHPHKLFGKENCERGIYSKIVHNLNMTCSFVLGIQCVKREDVAESLEIRQSQNIDPFRTGFNHRGNIDLHELRLCFQVFIRGPDNCLSLPLLPVVSDPIYNRKNCSKLNIVKLSHYSASATGGTDVILLCDPVDKDDIEVWFYEKQDTRIVWETRVTFQPTDVHRRVAISFKIPPYSCNQNTQHSAEVFVELRKPSTNQRGEPRSFTFVCTGRDPEGLPCKRFKALERMNRDKYFQEGLLCGFSAQTQQMPIAVPRTSRRSSHQKANVESASGNSSMLNARSNEPYQQPSTSFESALKTMPTSNVSLSASSQLAFSQMNDLSTTSGGPSQVFVIPRRATLPAPIIQQSSTSFELDRSSILPTVPTTIVDPSTCLQMTYNQLPILANSSNVHSPASVTSSIATLSSTIISQPSTSLQQYGSSILTTAPTTVVDSFTLPQSIYNQLPILAGSPSDYSQVPITSSIAILSTNIPQSSISFQQYGSSILTTLPSSIANPYSLPQLTNTDLPFLDTSLTIHNQASIISEAPLSSSITTQPLTSVKYCGFQKGTIMPNPDVRSSTSSHFTSAHLSALTTSSGVHSQVSAIPTIATLPLPITTHSFTSFECYRSPNLTTTPVPAASPFNTLDLRPCLSASPDPHSQASESPMTDTFTIQEMLQQYFSPDDTGMENSEEAIIEKFDSLGLNMTLSDSLFDSTPITTDPTIYQVPSSSTKDEQLN